MRSRLELRYQRKAVERLKKAKLNFVNPINWISWLLTVVIDDVFVFFCSELASYQCGAHQ